MKKPLLCAVIALLMVCLQPAMAGDPVVDGPIADDSDTVYGKPAPVQTLPIVVMVYKCNRQDFNLLKVTILTPKGQYHVPGDDLRDNGSMRQKVYIFKAKAQAHGLAFSAVVENHPDCQAA